MTSQEDRICNTIDPEFTTKGLDPKSLTTTEIAAQTFASFFPYSWKFIYAKNVDRTSKPEWRTETRYPITGRRLYDHWADNETLIGVRFGNQTKYALLDIDKGSPLYLPPYHKQLIPTSCISGRSHIATHFPILPNPLTGKPNRSRAIPPVQ